MFWSIIHELTSPGRGSLFNRVIILVCAFLGVVGFLFFGAGRPADPHWGDRAALFVSEKPLPSPLPFETWRRPGDEKLLRDAVSRSMKQDVVLRNVYVVRNKKLVNFDLTLQNETNPLPRKHVKGYPLIFCGHMSAQGKSFRFSYIPQAQELIVRDMVSRAFSADEYDYKRMRREKRLETEHQRICGRSPESSPTVTSAAR